MKSALQAAMDTLSGVLEQENAALAGLNLAGAGAFLAAKRAATEALATAGDRFPGTGLSFAAAVRLRDLAAENRRLLERAITVQGRVIAVVARATPRSAVTLRYAADGVFARTGRPVPMALSARA